MSQYKKVMHDALKGYASVHKSGLSGRPNHSERGKSRVLICLEARRESSHTRGRNNASAVPVSTFDDEWIVI